jgi:hypothetical protein
MGSNYVKLGLTSKARESNRLASRRVMLQRYRKDAARIDFLLTGQNLYPVSYFVPAGQTLIRRIGELLRSSQGAKIADAAGFTSTTLCPILKKTLAKSFQAAKTLTVSSSIDELS